MAVSRVLRRLLRIRDLEEEQHRLALESALGDLHRLEGAMEAAREGERRGRAWTQQSARSGECADHQAGLVETHAAQHYAAILGPRIAASEREAIRLKQAFLDKRVERRQAETLIEESAAKDAVESNRHSQQAMDDWYGSQFYGERPDTRASRDEKTLAKIPPKDS